MGNKLVVYSKKKKKRNQFRFFFWKRLFFFFEEQRILCQVLYLSNKNIRSESAQDLCYYNATERIIVEEKNLFQRHQMTKPSAHSESVISSSSLRYVLELYGFLLLCNLYILKQQKDFPSINLKSVFCAWSFKNTSWENRQKVREGVECHNEYYFAKFSLMQICNKRWKLKKKKTDTDI